MGIILESEFRNMLTLWNNKKIKPKLNFKGVQNINYPSTGKWIWLIIHIKKIWTFYKLTANMSSAHIRPFQLEDWNFT